MKISEMIGAIIPTLISIQCESFWFYRGIK